MFDDYATNIAGKKRMLGHTHGEEVANKWFYSSGAALRRVDRPTFEITSPASLPSSAVVNGATYQYENLTTDYWDFDGTNDDIDGPPCNTILDQSSSIELWVYFDDVTTRQTIISGYDSSGATDPNRWDFEMRDGTFRGGFHDNGYFSSTTNISVGVNNTGWQHAVFVLSSSTLKFYLNGVEDASQSCSGFNFGGPTIALGIGDRNDSSIGHLNGRIAEVRTYDIPLSAEQVFQNYNATVGTYEGNEVPNIAPKLTTDVPYSFTQVSGTSLKFYVDFGNRYSYSTAQNSLHSSYKNASNWGFTNTSKQDNAAIAPDGTKTATLVTEHDITGFHFISSSAGLGGARTFSAYLKAGNQPRATMFLTQTGNNGARFDLETGQVLTVFGTGNTASIVDVGGGWYRCMIANDGVAANVDNQLRISPFNGATQSEAPGSPLRSIYVWGPQVEKSLTNPPTAGRYAYTMNQSKNKRGTLNNLLIGGEKPFLNGNIANQLVTHRDGYLAFDGGDDHINFSNAISLTDGLGWTVEVWLRVMDPVNDNTTNTWNYFFRDEPGGAPTYECGMYSNTTEFSIKDNDAANTTLSMTMTPGVWHYIAFGVTQLTDKIFMASSDANGVITHQLSTGTVSAVPCVIKRLMSNQNGNSNQFLKAHVGEIRIKDNATGTSLLEANFNATRSKYGI